jgi:hypothetical protein
MKPIYFLICGMLILVLWIIYCQNNSKKTTYVIRQQNQKIEIKLTRQSELQYLLIATTFENGKLLQTNTWPLGYDVFKLDTGDVNNDCSTDILVGVIKKTKFDSICRKRLFIFKLLEGYIRPLWLGSRVSQPLEDFRFCNGKSSGVIRTIELERDGLFLVAEYRWQSFGLAFIRYLVRETPLKQAKYILKTN